MAESQSPAEVKSGATSPQEAPKDERIREMSPLRKALIRPELGAICGTILVFLFFVGIASDSGMFAPEVARIEAGGLYSDPFSAACLRPRQQGLRLGAAVAAVL